MTLHANIGGVYKQSNDVWCNIGGVWKKAESIYTNVGGVWKEGYSSFNPILYDAGVENTEVIGTFKRVYVSNGYLSGLFAKQSTYLEFGDISSRHGTAVPYTSQMVDLTGWTYLKMTCDVTNRYSRQYPIYWGLQVRNAMQTENSYLWGSVLASYSDSTTYASGNLSNVTFTIDVTSINTGVCIIPYASAMSGFAQDTVRVAMKKLWLE